MIAIFRHCDFGNKAAMENVDLQWLKARMTGQRGEKARLAEALGIKPDQVAKILTGVRRIQTDEIPKLRAFFNEAVLTISAEEQRLLEMYRTASAARREAAEALLAAPPSKSS